MPTAALTAGELVDGQVLPTLNGLELVVDILDDGTVTIIAEDSVSTVIIPDVAAGDSVVHVVDTVLLPFSPADFAPAPEPEEELLPGAEFDCSPLQYLQSRPDLSILADFFTIDTGFFPELYAAAGPNETTEYTFFLPNDDAFARAFEFFNATFEDFVPDDVDDADGLNNFLLYHVLPGTLIASTDLPGLTATVPTGAAFFGIAPDPNSTLSVIDGVITPDGVLPGGLLPNDVFGPPTPIEVDIPFCGAVLHVIDFPLFSNGPDDQGLDTTSIDTVLLPFAPAPEPEEECSTVVGLASSIDDFSILVDAVVAADLVAPLNDPEAALTVFAPTNDAFVALLGALGLESLEDVPLDLLTNVLLYHVVPAVAFSTDLSDGQVLPTLLEGAELTVDLSDGVVIDGVGSDATVVAPDIAACAAVVHVIDTVLLPIVPGEEECTPRFGACSTGEECCSGTCRGPTFTFPFYRRCTLF